jgi:flagellar capping protein FliD
MRKKDNAYACSSKKLLFVVLAIIFISFIYINFSMSQPDFDSNVKANENILQIVDNINSSPAGVSATSDGIENNSQLKSNLRTKESKKHQKKKVAYAITVTKDGPFIDGALVLGYSALKVHKKSNYKADLVAFVTSKVVKARPILQKYGWIVIEKELPVALTEILNTSYVKRVKIKN